MNRFFNPGVAGAVAVVSTLAGAPALAAYPAQNINLVVPYSAGGGADNAARVIAQGMSEVSGRTVIIENRGGASGTIGAAYVARAQPDGYTVLYDASAFAITPSLRSLPYDIETDFIPVSQAISVPNIMVVSVDSTFSSVQELVKAAAEDPERYTFASYGPGSLAQMAGELLMSETGIEMIHVPYKGGAPALVDVMGGQVDTYFANAASSLNYVQGNKLRALAVTSTERMAELPDVPTVAESGVPDFEVLEWNGFFLPAGASPEVVEALQKLVQEALALPGVQERLAALGLTVVGSSSAEFTDFVLEEHARWSELIETKGISVN